MKNDIGPMFYFPMVTSISFNQYLNMQGKLSLSNKMAKIFKSLTQNEI